MAEALSIFDFSYRFVFGRGAQQNNNRTMDRAAELTAEQNKTIFCHGSAKHLAPNGAKKCL